ncbi:MAG: DUF6311 domain-containing protein [Bacteroidales bacterium]|nr:DUF6311 domain-containing protein [Bacteroidales bacterium]
MISDNTFYRILTKKPVLIIFLSLVSALILFYLKFGFAIINPLNNGWLMAYDYATHYLGWLFFKNEPWDFPIGTINNYFYPLGSNIGYTDSIPLMAIIGKLLSPILPEQTQYIGFWLLSCFILQGFFAALIVNKIRLSFLPKMAMSILLIFSPILMNRPQHPALCVHWLILAVIWLYLRSKESDSPSSNIKWIWFFNILSAFIHPYITPMVLLPCAAILYRMGFIHKFISIKKTLLNFFLLIFSVLAIWYILGFFGLSNGADYGAAGYGWFSTNLNALYNANKTSSFSLMTHPLYSDGQMFEGYAYLGLGLLLMLVFALFFVAMNFKYYFALTKVKRNALLIVILIFTGILAITHIVTFNNKVIFSFQLPHIIEVLLNPYRSSGRLFWPVYYFLIIFVFLVFSKILKKHKILSYFIVLIPILQLYDLKPLYSKLQFEKSNYSTNETVVKWTEILEPFEHIITYPPFEKELMTGLDYVPFAYISALNNKTITTGYIARYNTAASIDYKTRLEASLLAGQLDENSVYI